MWLLSQPALADATALLAESADRVREFVVYTNEGI